ncbi:MAG TPA: hypothetical protein VJ549_05180 [Geothrix sp.]|nr:hypothetical protein [Geothrix sp.]
MPAPDKRLAWAKALGALGLLVFLPFLLLATPLAVIARLWRLFLLEAAFLFLMAVLIGAMAGAALPALVWLERHLRAWVARFSADPEALWLDWARHAHRPVMAQACLDRAVQLGGREALFQEALVFLEGGFGSGGHIVGVDRLRQAALRGHPEAAFRLAEALRTAQAGPVAQPEEAAFWYRRSAVAGFGPAAAWLARAHQTGDGVPNDEAEAHRWAGAAEKTRPHPQLSSSLFRHDAGSEDRLVGWTRRVARGAEGAADRVVAHRIGRGAILLGAALGIGFALFTVGTFFWVGSSGLFHLPLLVLLPVLSMLAWQALKLRREGPRRRRDRLLEAAQAGDPEACYQLGLAHRRGGPHRPKDDLSAVHWFRKAAEAGHREAMAAMAEACLGGHGVLRDPREAARWAEAARRESTS